MTDIIHNKAYRQPPGTYVLDWKRDQLNQLHRELSIRNIPNDWELAKIREKIDRKEEIALSHEEALDTCEELDLLYEDGTPDKSEMTNLHKVLFAAALERKFT